MKYIYIVYRVHWLKAKAHSDRWHEEVTLILSEMTWTEKYFQFMASKWESLASQNESAEGGLQSQRERQGERDGEMDTATLNEGNVSHQPSDESPGLTSCVYKRSLACYAAKERSRWKRMASRAADAFSVARLKCGME